MGLSSPSMPSEAPAPLAFPVLAPHPQLLAPCAFLSFFPSLLHLTEVVQQKGSVLAMPMASGSPEGAL